MKKQGKNRVLPRPSGVNNLAQNDCAEWTGKIADNAGAGVVTGSLQLQIGAASAVRETEETAKPKVGLTDQEQKRQAARLCVSA